MKFKDNKFGHLCNERDFGSSCHFWVVELAETLKIIPPLVNLVLDKPVKSFSIWVRRKDLIKEHITDGKSGSIWPSEEKALKVL